MKVFYMKQEVYLVDNFYKMNPKSYFAIVIIKDNRLSVKNWVD